MNQRIVDFLRTTAKEKGLTYEKISERVHLSSSTLCRIFKGQQDPTMDQLHSIVEVGLEAKMSELYAEVGEQEMIAAENDGFKGLDALRAEYEQRESRIRENCTARVEAAEKAREDSIRALTERTNRLEESHAQEIARLQAQHAQAIQTMQAMHDQTILAQATAAKEASVRHDDTYQRSVSYLKDQISLLQTQHERELNAIINQHDKERDIDAAGFEKERSALLASIDRLSVENKRLRRWNFWLAIALATETAAVLGVMMYDMLNRNVGWFRSLMIEHGSGIDSGLRG